MAWANSRCVRFMGIKNSSSSVSPGCVGWRFVGTLTIKSSLLVVIHDFYPFGCVVFPDEANAVLVVNADAVLAFAVTFERFKTIGWRDLKLIQGFYRIELVKLSACHLPNRFRANFSGSFRVFAIEDILGA